MKPATLIALGILALLAIPLLRKPAPTPGPVPLPTQQDVGEQLALQAGQGLIDWLFTPRDSTDSGVISIQV